MIEQPLSTSKKKKKLPAAKSEGHFALLIFTRLDALLRATRPRRSIVLALDGPAPLAKLLTQRLRRKRAGRKATKAGEGEVVSDVVSAHAAAAAPFSGFNSIQLTPGSPLMQFVNDALEYFICARLEGSHAYRKVQWELSGADVPGEGELKLLSRLRSHWWGDEEEERATRSSSRGERAGEGEWGGSSSSDEDEDEPRRPRRFSGARPGESHCVVGGDSDLLLMASLADASGPVFVMADEPAREQQQQGVDSSSGIGGGRYGGRGGRGGRGGGRYGGPRGREPFPERKRRVFSVDALDAAIARDLNLNSSASSPSSSSSRQQLSQRLLAARRDLCLLSIISCGNDYLPPVHGIDLRVSWAAYRAAMRRSSPESSSSSLRAIVAPPPPGPGGGSASIDPELLAVVVRAGATARGWRPRKSGGKREVSSSSDDGDEPPRSSPPPRGGGDDDDLQSDFRPACDPASYLQGASWVLGMYCTGVCADWRFCYDARGPAVEELLAELEGEAAKRKTEGASSAAAPPLSYSLSRKSPPLAPAVCAAALLPPGPAGAAAAPAPLRSLWDVSSPGGKEGKGKEESPATKGGKGEKVAAFPAAPRDPALVELFTVCDACESLSDRSGIAQAAMLEALGAKKRLELEVAAAAAATSGGAAGGAKAAAPPPETAAAAAVAAEAVDVAVSAARDAVRAVARARNAHVRACHPYAPFPLEKLERAVEEALLREDGGGKGYASLLAFGRPARYWRSAAAEAFYSGNARVRARAAASRGSVPPPFRPLPSPPSSRLPILEPCVRRPIVREGE